MAENRLQDKIKDFISSKQVAIYMKGSPDFPQCGFSAQTVQALRASGMDDKDLAHCDVLSDPEIREGIKQFTKWPTIPQVFIKGKFVGGCDIVTELAQSGELEELLKG